MSIGPHFSRTLQCKSVDTNAETEKSIPAETELIKKCRNKNNITPISRKVCTTPKEELEEDNSSPYFMKFTQDSAEDELDVIWDWDSPRSRKKSKNLHRKRILQSPNIPKKQISNKSLPKFNSLKAELEVLVNKVTDQENQDTFSQNDIFNDTKFDNTSTLVDYDENIFVKPKDLKCVANNHNDLFDDDSLDEEMIKCSQKVEAAFKLNQWCSSIITNHNNNKDIKTVNSTIQDDSFDCLLEEIKDEDIELLSQTSSNNAEIPMFVLSKKPSTVSSPRSISRTNSVPIEFLSKKPSSNSTFSSFFRTKSEELGDNFKTSSPSQCSIADIEKKRQEAKLKLEFKRKQNEIEKKRLEAIEKLKKNRMQRLQLSQTSAILQL